MGKSAGQINLRNFIDDFRVHILHTSSVGTKVCLNQNVSHLVPDNSLSSYVYCWFRQAVCDCMHLPTTSNLLQPEFHIIPRPSSDAIFSVEYYSSRDISNS